MADDQPASPSAEEQLPPGHERANGTLYMRGPKGELIPRSTIKDKKLLADETARDLFGRAQVLHDAMAAFKKRVFDDVDAYCALGFQRYGVELAGEKGNMTIYSFDQLVKVVVQVANRIQFGDEVHAAKALVDECLADWTIGSPDELKAIIANAFRTDNEGQLNRYAILALRQYNFTDPRWLRAMEAIADSMQVVGSARYVRFYRKAASGDGWDPLSLDMATV